jgi:hypothetical protein
MENYIAEINTMDKNEMVRVDGMLMTRAEAIEYMRNK